MFRPELTSRARPDPGSASKFNNKMLHYGPERSAPAQKASLAVNRRVVGSSHARGAKFANRVQTPCSPRRFSFTKSATGSIETESSEVVSALRLANGRQEWWHSDTEASEAPLDGVAAFGI